MFKELNKIKSVSFEELQKSGELTLLLLSMYSKLFLAGSQPSICGKCMKRYYLQLINQGFKILQFMKEKTNELKPGLHFVRSEAMHFSNANLTDEKAIKLLEDKKLKPEAFIKLPEGFESEEEDAKEEKVELSELNKGKFTTENLDSMKGNLLIAFAKGVTEKTPKNKVEAIEFILDWQTK